MPFACHDYEMEYLRNLRQLTARAAYFRRMSDFELICFKQPYERHHLI